VAGNWKMNGTAASCRELAEGLRDALAGIDGVDTAVCPPFPYLAAVCDILKDAPTAVGSQNVYCEPKGAFTGETAPAMLLDIGCTYAIIGHSERRHVLGETNDLVRKKIGAALEAGLKPIVCVGELLEEREAGRTEAVVGEQVAKAIEGLSAQDMDNVTVAYEPVWAIGTGKTATPQQANDVHVFIRGLVAKTLGDAVAAKLRIQYGGSVKPENAADLLGQPDIDGALVGGASLKVDSFKAIVEAGA
jgi:triosephosphate isomerase